MTEVAFQLRGAHKSRVEQWPTRTRGRLARVTEVLALAIYFQDLVDRGEAKDYADVARLSCLCRERVSQIVRLNYLAPDIQVEILYLPPASTRYPISETSLRKIANLLSWADQRAEWGRLKACYGLADLSVRVGVASA